MKEQDITPKVIELAKEIARHWRMEIYRGCWILTPDEFLLFEPRDMFLDGVALRFTNGNYSKEWFSVPSISDCLEKLREHANENITIFIDTSMIWFVTLDMHTQKKKTNQSKSLHEALLFALLEVLKVEK